MITALLIIALIQLACFLIAYFFKTDKLTDLAYGSTFAIVAAINLFVAADKDNAPAILINLLIIIWGIRLAGYLFIRINKMGRDNRFDQMREKFFRFGGFWLLQAVAISIISLPSHLSLKFDEISIVTYLGLLLAGTGIVIEAVADWQKFRFKQNPANKDKWINSGLWAYSRHANYLGEIIVWWGLWLAVASGLALTNIFIALVSPVFITYLLVFVSGIPLLEKRYQERYTGNSDYTNYTQRTAKLIPWIW